MNYFLMLNAIELGALYLVVRFNRQRRERRAAHVAALISRVKEASHHA